MITIIINKLMIIFFVFSVLHTVRSLYYFIQAYVKSTKYTLTKGELIFLGITISYIISSLFQGIKIL